MTRPITQIAAKSNNNIIHNQLIISNFKNLNLIAQGTLEHFIAKYILKINIV